MMKKCSVRCLKFFFWIGLYVCFMICAVIVKQQMESSGAVELWGWDYQAFVSNIQNWGYITYFGFRHPGLGMILSPLVALEHLWTTAYLVFMPGVAVVTSYLIFKMSGWFGLLIWLCFPTTWLMASMPESFPFAQLALAISFYWVMKTRMVEQHEKHRQFYWMILFSVVNGMITLSNGLKPVAAYLMRCRDRRMTRIVLYGILFAIVLVGAVFYLRSLYTGRDLIKSIVLTLSWVPESRDFGQELYGFFVRPVGLVQSLFLYPLLILSIIRFMCIEDKSIIWAIISYFGVDVTIHFVIGWGMMEPWIFAPHWLFMVPVVIGRGITNASGRLNCLR